MILLAIERISGVRLAGLETATGRLNGPGTGAEVVSARHTLERDIPDTERDPRVSRSVIEEATNELNRMLEHVNQRLSFKIHEGSERMIVYVIDNQTNEVVRELPPERFLDTIAKIREFIGILFDERF